jgi:selenoprotein W-related protein
VSSRSRSRFSLWNSVLRFVLSGGRIEDVKVQASARPRISIAYCTQCLWLLRAAWMAQELLSTFGTDIGEVALVPGTGGVFEIRCGDQVVWDRKTDGGFPDVKTLKQRVRDLIAPDRDLGHTDRART